MSKLIIRFDDDIEKPLEYVATVIAGGRISHNKMGDQYCYHTTFKDVTHVSAFKPSSKTDTFVIYREQKEGKDE